MKDLFLAACNSSHPGQALARLTLRNKASELLLIAFGLCLTMFVGAISRHRILLLETEQRKLADIIAAIDHEIHQQQDDPAQATRNIEAIVSQCEIPTAMDHDL